MLAWSLWQRADWSHASQFCLSDTHEPWEFKNTTRSDDQRHTDDSSELCQIYWQSARTVKLNTNCTSAALPPRGQDIHITEVCQVYQTLQSTFILQSYSGIRPINTRTFCRTEWQRTNSVTRSFFLPVCKPVSTVKKETTRSTEHLALHPQYMAPSHTSLYKSSFLRSLTRYIRLHEEVWNIVCHLLGHMV
jgi:hypothetical protein